MAEAQKARWAKIKGEPVTPELPKAKRQISAEGMKRIVAATKKRWKRQRAEAVAKKAAPAKSVARKPAVNKPPAVTTQAAGQ